MTSMDTSKRTLLTVGHFKEDSSYSGASQATKLTIECCRQGKTTKRVTPGGAERAIPGPMVRCIN